MNETVSVRQALAKGRLYLNFLPLITFLLCLFVPVYLHSGLGCPEVWIGYGFGIGLVSFVFIHWIAMPKWRLWAVRNVRNVHELQRDAIQERLWPTLTGKLEYWSEADRSEWRSLQRKFHQPDIFRDDFSIPKKTLLYHSKVKAGIVLVFMLIALGCGTMMILKEERTAHAWIIMGAGLFLGIAEGRKYFDRKPQMAIGEDGIRTPDGVFFDWDDISGDEVEVHGFGKNQKIVLSFGHPQGHESIRIDSYSPNFKKIRTLLKVYRARHDNRKQNG